MPMRPLPLCRHSRCPERAMHVTGGYCATHEREHQHAYDGQRGTAHARGYNSNWRQVRALVLREQPVCPCGQRATDVDHITARRNGGTNERANLQGLCHACHSRKTVQQDGGWGLQRPL